MKVGLLMQRRRAASTECSDCAVDIAPLRRSATTATARSNNSSKAFQQNILLSVSIVCALLSSLHNVLDYLDTFNNSAHEGNGLSGAREVENDRTMPKNDEEYVLWSRDETYFQDCRSSMLHNDTWGKERAPFVDKVEVKHLIRAWEEEDGGDIKSLGLKIPPTLAVFTRANASEFTLELLKQIPQPYVIKTSHGSGMVARVHNNTYQCVKGGGECRSMGHNGLRNRVDLDKEAFKSIFRRHINEELMGVNKFTRNNVEPQYQFVPPSIIVEKDILLENDDIDKDVTYWYMSNGIPLFVSQQCESNKQYGKLGVLGAKRTFYSSRYERIPMKLGKDSCPNAEEKPGTWERQRQIVESMGKNLPNGVVRVDLYAGKKEIYFSEFTFTTATCKMQFKPAVADGMLYAVSHEKIRREDASRPEYVEEIIGGIGSWALVELNRQKEVRMMNHFPSPVDLCEGYQDGFLEETENIKHQTFNDCIGMARKVSPYSIRCLIADGNSYLASFGMHRHPTVQRVITKFAWDRIFAMVVVLVFMFAFQVGARERARSHIILINIFIAVIAVSSDVLFHRDGKWFSHLSTIRIIKESFNTFYSVHPVENTAVAMSHFLTYWVHAAQWFARSPRQVLIYCLLTEVVVQFVNEWTHHDEWRTDVRCARVSFINGMTVTVYDEVWREFVLGPFFVYFSLLPRFILHWTKVLFA